MDKGIPESGLKGDDHRFHNRLREKEKCSCSLRSGVDADHNKSNQTGWRDQAETRACLLEEQNGHQPRKATCSPKKDTRSCKSFVIETCRAHGRRLRIFVYKNTGKNQSLSQNQVCEECSRSRRGTLDDYGYRLSPRTGDGGAVLISCLVSLHCLYISGSKRKRELCKDSICEKIVSGACIWHRSQVEDLDPKCCEDQVEFG